MSVEVILVYRIFFFPASITTARLLLYDLIDHMIHINDQRGLRKICRCFSLRSKIKNGVIRGLRQLPILFLEQIDCLTRNRIVANMVYPVSVLHAASDATRKKSDHIVGKACC